MAALLPPTAGQEGLDVRPRVSKVLDCMKIAVSSDLIEIGQNKENRVDRRGKKNSAVSDESLSNQPRPIYGRLTPS